MKKRVSFGISLICLLAFTIGLIACGKINKPEEPKVNLTLKISDLTEEEFKEIGTKEIENATRKDFKKAEFILEAEFSYKVIDRKIEIPSIKSIISSIPGERYWYGSSNSQDNIGEKVAKYNEKVVFLSKGLEDDEIKDIFKGAEVKITWSELKDNVNEKTMNLIDYTEILNSSIIAGGYIT